MSRPFSAAIAGLYAPPAEGASAPWAPEADALLAVNRVIDDVRRGVIGGLCGNDGALAVLALEAAGGAALSGFARAVGGDAPRLVMTGRRAAVLGLLARGEGEPPHAVAVDGSPDSLARLAAVAVDPLAQACESLPPDLAVAAVAPDGLPAAAVHLMKRARLMPAAAVIELSPAARKALPCLWAEAADVLHHEQLLALSLKPVSRAQVPLADAPETLVTAFRPSDGGIEHLALVVGHPEPGEPVLTRLHSECFTGDILGSLRCDCGDQLRGAIREIAEAGAGVLLYLAQEGRGIGLVNKLRAYDLQDAGLDTMEANEQLGFDDDERIYLPAAAMLKSLGFTRVRLLTNNPAKVVALGRHGITVVERVPHIFPSNDHNRAYLEVKRVKGGHLF